MPSLLNSRTDSIVVIWTQNQEKHGDSGTGNCHNVEDGLSGDTSTPITMEEHGHGSITNHILTVEPSD